MHKVFEIGSIVVGAVLTVAGVAGLVMDRKNEDCEVLSAETDELDADDMEAIEE